jgi:fatty-acyl-CoA synthase
MLIRGGENIFPREIEEFLYTHPKIDTVEVFGIPDAKYGEVVAAWIRTTPNANLTTTNIQDFCRGKLAHFKIPQFIKFVEEFPMTITGKVKKYVMREEYARELGRDSADMLEASKGV